MSNLRCLKLVLGASCAVLMSAGAALAEGPPAIQVDPFIETVARVRPSVVAIGSYQFNDTPSIRFFGTGFVVKGVGDQEKPDGNLVVTNAHVVDALYDRKKIDNLRVFFPDTSDVDGRAAKVVAEDALHDLALVRFEGPPARGLDLELDRVPRQGATIGVLGYPIGTRLGLVPAAHRGVVAAVVPAVLPLPKGIRLTPELAEAIQKPYSLYQLDLVVFPGNSGSPLFDGESARVIGIMNKVLATKTREHLLDTPSGIAYAVPVRWVHELMVRTAAQTTQP